MVKRGVALGLMLTAGYLQAVEEIDAAQLMAALTWEKRVLLVFAPHPEDADFRQQDSMLEAVAEGLVERDMTVIKAFANARVTVDGQSYEQPATGFYRRFDVASGEFRVILVGKDGGVKLNQEHPLSDADLFALIDSMPMRRNEMLRDG